MSLAPTYAKLAFSMSSIEIGDTVKLPVIVNVKELVDGIDVQIELPPEMELVAHKLPDVPGLPVTPGNPKVIITPRSVWFSKLPQPGSQYKGKAVIAVLTLKATAAGRAKVAFTFTKGSTTDSNVVARKMVKNDKGEMVEQPVDILATPTNITYYIR